MHGKLIPKGRGYRPKGLAPYVLKDTAPHIASVAHQAGQSIREIVETSVWVRFGICLPILQT